MMLLMILRLTINTNDGSVACFFAEMMRLRRRRRRSRIKARLRWKVWAFSPRDGGWVSFLSPGAFKMYSNAMEGIQIFQSLFERAGDYRGFMVKQVLLFRIRRDRHGPMW